MGNRFFALLCALVWSDPTQLLIQIRSVFRSHEVPRYVSYTISREQMTDDGLPDLLWTYTDRIWYRSADGAALGRRKFRGHFENLVFMRPAFNEPRDPGPPTADLFERAPSQPTFEVRPEDAAPLPQIATVTAYGELEYRVPQVKTEGTLIHLWLVPRRDPDRNRLRELWVDSGSLELRKVIATDRLYILGGPTYMMTDTIVMGEAGGRPVVTDVHGRVNFDVDPWAAGFDVDYHFRDIVFPADLPSWYFQPPTYGQHIAEAPQ